MVECNHCHKMTLVLPQVSGRADTNARHFILAEEAEIEVKDVRGTSFAFSEIKENQRKFLTKHEDSYICVGKIVAVGSRETIHSIFVIPWKKWVAMESELILILESGSLPYSYALYEKKPVVRTADLVTRFAQYALEYRDGDWHIPDGHPLAIHPEVMIPWHQRNQMKEVV